MDKRMSISSHKHHNHMQVIKRDGSQEDVKFDKILNRISQQCFGLDEEYVKPDVVAQKVIEGIYDGIKTIEIDEYTIEVAGSLVVKHPDYSKLAARVAISSLHKETPKKFTLAVEELYEWKNDKGERMSTISDKLYRTIKNNKRAINEKIVMERDFLFDIFGYKTLERAYLLRKEGRVMERPQYLFMRVALGLWPDDLDRAFMTYDMLSTHHVMMATPTLFNSGTERPQLSSCFLFNVQDDLEDILQRNLKMGMISKYAGGIGISISRIRSTGSYIKGTGGHSNGIIPMLQMYNNLARYVDQGGGKRKGSIAVYLEPWHPDIEIFLESKKPTVKEELAVRDLFYAMWTPDLFMQRVIENKEWSLIDPQEAPELVDLYDTMDNKAFTERYEQLEKEGKVVKKINARRLMEKITATQMESGTPYILFKDNVNRKSNQKNIGTINSSNLCVTHDTKVRIKVDGIEDATINTSIKDLNFLYHNLDSHGIHVESYNETEKKTEFKRVLNSAMTSPLQEIYIIENEETGKKLKCTADHEIYTQNRGYVKAKDLDPYDVILTLE